MRNFEIVCIQVKIHVKKVTKRRISQTIYDGGIEMMQRKVKTLNHTYSTSPELTITRRHGNEG